MNVIVYKCFGSEHRGLYSRTGNKYIIVSIIMISYQDKVDFVQSCQADPKFFVENTLYAEDGELYVLEPHQSQFLRCDEAYRMLFWARRLSKSTTIRWDILHKTFFTPSLRSLVVLPSWSQAQDFGNEVQDLIQRSPMLGDMFTKTNATTMALQNGSRINLASAGKEGVAQLGRGARYLAFDEAQQIPDRVYGFILPIMRGTPGKKYQVMSGTPLGKIGMFWDTYTDAKLILEKNKVRKIDVSTDEEHFVVFQRQTAYLDDLSEIIESGTKRVKIPELKMDRKRMGEVDFLREYCLEWMDTIGTVFPKELIEACTLTEESQQFSSNNECVMGLDLGKQRNNSVLTVAERLPNDKLKVIFIKAFPLGTSYKEIAKYCFTTLRTRFPHLRKMMIDKTGVGGSVIEEFQELVKGTGIRLEGFNFAGPEKKKGLVEATVLDMEREKISFVYNRMLINEMLSYKRVISEKTGKIGYEKMRGGSDDYIDSFMLCAAADRGIYSALGEINVISAGMNVLNSLNPLTKNKNPRVGKNSRLRGRI